MDLQKIMQAHANGIKRSFKPNKTGFHSSDHKVGDTVVLAQQSYGSREIHRHSVTIRNITKSGRIQITTQWDEFDEFQVATLYFSASGDIRGYTGGWLLWLEDKKESFPLAKP